MKIRAVVLHGGLAASSAASVLRGLAPVGDRWPDVVVAGPVIQNTEGIVGEGRALFEVMKSRGMEGIVAKRLGSRYAPRQRTNAWIKVKVPTTPGPLVGLVRPRRSPRERAPMTSDPDDPTMPKRPPIAALKAIERIRHTAPGRRIDMYLEIRETLQKPHEYPPNPGMAGIRRATGPGMTTPGTGSPSRLAGLVRIRRPRSATVAGDPCFRVASRIAW